MDLLISDLNGGVVAVITGNQRVDGRVISVSPVQGHEDAVASLMALAGDAGPSPAFLVVTGQRVAAFFEVPSSVWNTPVPGPEDWYAATWHDPTGKKNDGYEHTGIDLNLDKAPWGDVDRGQQVLAIASGIVLETGYTDAYLGVVVLLVEHDGAPLYVRYWHLAQDATHLALRAGQPVAAGQVIGSLGDYKGGDHLHFDVARDMFSSRSWLTPGIRWIDPIPVLKAHLNPDLVDQMVSRNR
jgi:murein DD-endopeptidase MepM/ murein hydrolase activator NlpD